MYSLVQLLRLFNYIERFWCILHTDNYKDCVLKAINLGGDTDTIAAVSGGLAGIIYGYEDIPIKWINNLQRKDIIDSCLF